MKSTVEFYSPSGQRINTITNVERVTIFQGYIRVTYREEKKIKVLESNLPFIYYDGEK